MSTALPTVGISDLLALVRAHWLAIGLVVLLTSSIAVAAALIIPPTYRAEVILAPVKRQSGGLGGLGGLAGQFGGLASLAGISLTDDDAEENLATLRSRVLTEAFIKENQLLPVLFAKKWNAASRQWITSDPDSIPTLWDGNKIFDKKIRRIRMDSKTGLVTLTIDWTNPVIAAAWANDIVRRCNTLTRERALRIAESNIAYLQKQSAKTDLTQIREAISRLMESEIKNVMVTQGTEEYAFKVIDPAVVPEERYSPSRSLLVIAGFLFGLCGSLAWFLVRKPRITRNDQVAQHAVADTAGSIG